MINNFRNSDLQSSASAFHSRAGVKQGLPQQAVELLRNPSITANSEALNQKIQDFYKVAE